MATTDDALQVVHLRLCRRATELRSPIAALEDAAEEIVDLTVERDELQQRVDHQALALKQQIALATEWRTEARQAWRRAVAYAAENRQLRKVLNLEGKTL